MLSTVEKSTVWDLNIYVTGALMQFLTHFHLDMNPIRKRPSTITAVYTIACGILLYIQLSKYNHFECFQIVFVRKLDVWKFITLKQLLKPDEAILSYSQPFMIEQIFPWPKWVISDSCNLEVQLKTVAEKIIEKEIQKQISGIHKDASEIYHSIT